MSQVRTWNVPSESSIGKVYTVSLFLEQHYALKPGSFTCTCPAWKFRRSPVSERTCKHIQKVQDAIRMHDESFHAIREMRGSEVSFHEDSVGSGRLRGLLDTIMREDGLV